jgi:hypothetical protein
MDYLPTYRDLEPVDLDLLNEIEKTEARLEILYADVMKRANIDRAALRWAAEGRTYIETGLMYWVKAVTRPKRSIGRV